MPIEMLFVAAFPSPLPRLKTSAKPLSKTNPAAGCKVTIKMNSSSCCSRSTQVKSVAQQAVNGLVFNQNFDIHSFDIGPDKKVTIQTLLNLLQETALNHLSGGQVNNHSRGGGFCTTPEMSRKNLIWVIVKMNIFMECYPTWGDNVQVDTWNAACGENKLRRGWHVYDTETNQTFMRATSVWMTLNKQTRKLSKIPEELRAGLRVFDRASLPDMDNRKLRKLSDDTAHGVTRGISPIRSDLDVNQHVNNVKYISWILQSVPTWIHESYELSGMSLEYRRECGIDSMLESLVALSTASSDSWPETTVEFDHMLRLECGAEVVRGRTQWRPKLVIL